MQDMIISQMLWEAVTVSELEQVRLRSVRKLQSLDK